MTDKQIVYYKKDCFNEPYCSLGKVIEQLHYYKQTLTEIKEIANRIYSEVITENWQSILAKQILQKISECEV